MANIEREIPGESQGKPSIEPHSPEPTHQAQEIWLAQVVRFAAGVRQKPAELQVDVNQALGVSEVIPLDPKRIETINDLFVLRDEILSRRLSEDMPPKSKD